MHMPRRKTPKLFGAHPEVHGSVRKGASEDRVTTIMLLRKQQGAIDDSSDGKYSRRQIEAGEHGGVNRIDAWTDRRQGQRGTYSKLQTSSDAAQQQAYSQSKESGTQRSPSIVIGPITQESCN
jgi:hypothetical protein